MSCCRLLVEEVPSSGAWNMAVDAALLNSVLQGLHSVVRLYRWSEPTVSLGYFQNAEEAKADSRLNGLPVVRRLSGGGAILHHWEWTYSCAVPVGHPLGRDPVQLYSLVHDVIIRWLQSRKVDARMRGETRTGPSTMARHDDARLHASGHDRTPIRSDQSLPATRPVEPFLCFGRGDPRDIVLDGHKIVGSAQRRRKGAILQHGSLLLRVSPYAPQFPGIRELTGRPELEDELPLLIAEGIAELFGQATRTSELTVSEREFATQVMTEF